MPLSHLSVFLSVVFNFNVKLLNETITEGGCLLYANGLQLCIPFKPLKAVLSPKPLSCSQGDEGAQAKTKSR